MTDTFKPTAVAEFILATQSITEEQDLTPHLAAMQTWREGFFQTLEQNRLTTINFNPQGEMTSLIQQINAWQQRAIQDSEVAYRQLSDAQSLMGQFEQKVMLLLFGKFNAGKSSLCNALADCFRQQNQTVQYFYLQQGKIIFTEDMLQEGATETTARLQGVCLGERLVLLDTPGLHSVTAVNAALTQRFLESADGMLWLTSSSSPGQVHELDGLAQELLRHKPLLPVITRSDYLEEDEVDGDIVQVLCNKSEPQRQLQETDVQARAIEKLIQMQADTHLLKPPVSISAYMAKQANFSDKALLETGFERLFLALLNLIQPALAYKQRKPAEIVLHYLQEHILIPFTQDFDNQLNEFEQKIHHEITSLESKKAQIIEQVWREVVPTLPSLFDKYRPLTDIADLLKDIANHTYQSLQTRIASTLPNSNLTPLPWLTLSLVNTVIYQTDDSDLNLSIANEDQLYKNICDSLRQALEQAMDNVIKIYTEQLQQLLNESEILKSGIGEYQQQLANIANALRAPIY